MWSECMRRVECGVESVDVEDERKKDGNELTYKFCKTLLKRGGWVAESLSLGVNDAIRFFSLCVGDAIHFFRYYLLYQNLSTASLHIG